MYITILTFLSNLIYKKYNFKRFLWKIRYFSHTSYPDFNFPSLFSTQICPASPHFGFTHFMSLIPNEQDSC